MACRGPLRRAWNHSSSWKASHNEYSLRRSRKAAPPVRQRLVKYGERHRVLGVFVELAGAVDHLFRALAVGQKQPRCHVDGQLRPPLDEAAALEELAEDGKMSEERDLRYLLVLGRVVQPAEDDGVAVPHGDGRLHVPDAKPGQIEPVCPDGDAAVDVAHFGVDLRADVPAAI